jgi:hypothetical protein
MGTSKTCILLFTAITLLTALPSLAADEIAITGTEAYCLACVCPDCNPGTWENNGSRVRNYEGIYHYTGSDPRTNDIYLRVAVNWNLDVSVYGPAWGSFYSCDASGNRIADGWEGTWSGKIFGFFPSYNWIADNVAHGIGAYKGLKMKTTTAYGNSFIGTLVGVITDVGRK